jgi:uncharacterized protein
MFAIDTNLIVYAHNIASSFHKRAKQFAERVMNERNTEGELTVCLPAQVLTEFVHVITWKHLEAPLSLQEAIQIVQDYLDSGIKIVFQQDSQIQTFVSLSGMLITRKKVFDVALASTLKDNHISGLYTNNADDFKGFDFLKVINPLSDEEKENA